MTEPSGVAQVPLAPKDNQSQAEAEAAQEQLLRAKYGGLLPKKKLVPKDNRYFDSADWQMSKQKGAPTPKLEPKLEPTTKVPPVRRNSQLSDGQ